MARFRERATARDGGVGSGDGVLAFLVLSRGSGFIRPTNQSGPLSNARIFIHFSAGDGRDTVAGIDRSTKVARFPSAGPNR